MKRRSSPLGATMEEDSDDVDKGTTTNKQLRRDDYNGTQKKPHQRSLLRGKKDENNETIASDSQPVSYTHLTLPTKA